MAQSQEYATVSEDTLGNNAGSAYEPCVIIEGDFNYRNKEFAHEYTQKEDATARTMDCLFQSLIRTFADFNETPKEEWYSQSAENYCNFKMNGIASYLVSGASDEKVQYNLQKILFEVTHFVDSKQFGMNFGVRVRVEGADDDIAYRFKLPRKCMYIYLSISVLNLFYNFILFIVRSFDDAYTAFILQSKEKVPCVPVEVDTGKEQKEQPNPAILGIPDTPKMSEGDSKVIKLITSDNNSDSDYVVEEEDIDEEGIVIDMT